MRVYDGGDGGAEMSVNALSGSLGSLMDSNGFEAINELRAYKEALDQNTIVSVTDTKGIITFANQNFCKISGYSNEELVGENIRILNSGYHGKEFFQQLWFTIRSGLPWHGEIRNRAKDGTFYWVDTTIVPQRTHGGKVDRYVSIRYDITASKANEKNLLAEVESRKGAEKLLKEILETIPDGIIAFDPEDRLLNFNSAYKKFHSSKAPHLVEGASFSDLLRIAVESGQYRDLPGDPDARDLYIENRIRRHRNPGRPILQQLSDGRWLQVQERRSSGGYTVGVCTDITHIKQAESKIKAQAEQDSLTGLANRSVLSARLAKILSTPREAGSSGALVLIDLDHFKDINDTLGHDAGDRLLAEIALRLKSVLRKSDTVARIGGDEFAVLLPNLTALGDVERVLRKMLARFGEPLKLGHRTISPGCSLGITFYPADGTTPSELLKNADIALYQAKAQGRGIWAFYNPVFKRQLENRQATTDAMRRALASNRIGIAVQTQVDFRTGAHLGFEVLARWNHKGRAVSPGEFVPLAEETGLIIPLGQSVLHQALSLARTLRDTGVQPGRLAINVAASQLKQHDFAAHVGALLRQYRIEPAALEVEVTENVLLDRAGSQVERSLMELNDLGVQIALDDFGTGHASLSHLKRFPVHRLKIDRSFVRELRAGSQDAFIVRAIINLAHGLGMTVVAEGIETREQFDILRDEGCDVAQGYLLGMPAPPSSAASFCRPPAGSADRAGDPGP